jgi:hypothetical protein
MLMQIHTYPLNLRIGVRNIKLLRVFFTKNLYKLFFSPISHHAFSVVTLLTSLRRYKDAKHETFRGHTFFSGRWGRLDPSVDAYLR